MPCVKKLNVPALAHKSTWLASSPCIEYVSVIRGTWDVIGYLSIQIVYLLICSPLYWLVVLSCLSGLTLSVGRRDTSLVNLVCSNINHCMLETTKNGNLKMFVGPQSLAGVLMEQWGFWRYRGNLLPLVATFSCTIKTWNFHTQTFWNAHCCWHDCGLMVKDYCARACMYTSSFPRYRPTVVRWLCYRFWWWWRWWWHFVLCIVKGKGKMYWQKSI